MHQTIPGAQQGLWTLTDEEGAELIAFTSFLSADIKAGGKVVSSPVEKGGFAAYNKVESPLEAGVSLAIQGDDAELQDVLDVLRELKAGTRLINLVTPEAEYASQTLESYNYTRTREGGLGLLIVELRLLEVRQVETRYAAVAVPPITKADAANPSDVSRMDKGRRQAREPRANAFKHDAPASGREGR